MSLHLARLKFCRHGPCDRKVKIPITKSLTALLMEERRDRLIAFSGTQRDHQAHAVSAGGLLSQPGQQVMLHSLAEGPA